MTAAAAAARGGLLRAGGYVVGQGMSVAAAALLFRHLGVADAGRYITVNEARPEEKNPKGQIGESYNMKRGF